MARTQVNRRRFFQLGAGVLATLGLGTAGRGEAQTTRALPGYAQDLGRYPFQLPELGYAYGALTPVIDAETMTLHHDAHHQSYVEDLNEALTAYPELHDRTLAELLTSLPDLPAGLRQELQNKGGGHLNHALWWRWLEPGGSQQPTGGSASLIADTFGTLDAFKKRFNAAAGERFGSGWAWLVVDAEGQASVRSTRNQDSPVSQGQVPPLGIDVWEHAYYLSYRNPRPEYISALWDIVNWDAVEAQYQAATEAFGL